MSDTSATPIPASTDGPLELELTVGNSLMLAIAAVAVVWTVVLLAMGL